VNGNPASANICRRRGDPEAKINLCPANLSFNNILDF
jgi:hypothetical protein